MATAPPPACARDMPRSEGGTCTKKKKHVSITSASHQDPTLLGPASHQGQNQKHHISTRTKSNSRHPRRVSITVGRRRWRSRIRSKQATTQETGNTATCPHTWGMSKETSQRIIYPNGQHTHARLTYPPHPPAQQFAAFHLHHGTHQQTNKPTGRPTHPHHPPKTPNTPAGRGA